MNTNEETSGSPLSFFVLIFVLSVPLWWIGGNKLPLPVNLPASALTAFVPAIAASLLSYRRSGVQGVKELVKRTLDYRRIGNKIWVLPTLFLAPAIYLLSYAIMRFTGLPLPAQVEVRWVTVPAFFTMYFIGGAGEEIGWTGYATDPVQARHGALKTGFLLGVGWALWHSIPFLQTGNSTGWVVWQCLKTVAMRVIIVWLYNNTGRSVFASILYHTADNVSWSLFPNNGSHYNPFVTGLINWIGVGIIMVGWGRKTLTRKK